MNFFTNLIRPKYDSLACCTCRTVTHKTDQTSHRQTCQNCGQVMHNMGAGFIPPHQSNKDEWQKVSFLIKHNFTFEYLSA